MAKNLLKLTNDVVSYTGSKVRAQRTVYKTTLTYELYNKQILKTMDLNAVVYELMILAAKDQLDLGEVLYTGDWTACELAGKVYTVDMFTENTNSSYEDFFHVQIVTPTFSCTFHPGETFKTIAEWEGVAGITGKHAFKFPCEGKEKPKDIELKPYKRYRGYHPTNVSLVEENKRIAEKFEVIGKVAQALTSEGMRKALSLLAALKIYDGEWYLKEMARRVMLRKLWDDYAKDKHSEPIPFHAHDFQHAPEAWKQVDGEYVKMLRLYFQQMLDAEQMPKEFKEGDWVLFRNRANMIAKYQKKFYCEGPRQVLCADCRRIEWRIAVRTKKFDCGYFEPKMLELWEDPKKGKKKEKKTTKAAKPKAEAKPQEQPSAMTLEDRLRAALRKQLGMAA